MFMDCSSVRIHCRLSTSAQPPTENFPDNPVKYHVLQYIVCKGTPGGQIWGGGGIGYFKNTKSIISLQHSW